MWNFYLIKNKLIIYILKVKICIIIVNYVFFYFYFSFFLCMIWIHINTTFIEIYWYAYKIHLFVWQDIKNKYILFVPLWSIIFSISWYLGAITGYLPTISSKMSFVYLLPFLFYISFTSTFYIKCKSCLWNVIFDREWTHIFNISNYSTSCCKEHL